MLKITPTTYYKLRCNHFYYRNDILDRFWKTGLYEKKPVSGGGADGGLVANGVKPHVESCKATLSMAMDILVSSNFERLMWMLAKGTFDIC